jgi:hypothetical protein
MNSLTLPLSPAGGIGSPGVARCHWHWNTCRSWDPINAMATLIGRCTRDLASVGWEVAVRPARAGAAWDGLVPHEELIRGWV